MTRRTMAERKRRQAERATRRDALCVLLSRMLRGALLDNERPLLRAHVEVELAEADELRRTVQGQQTAIQAAHDRTAAADAAIREAEAEAEEHGANYLGACGTIAAMHAAAVGEVRGPIRGVVEDVADMRAAYEAQHARADTLDRLCREQWQRAEQAEEHLAAYVDIFGPDAVDDFHKMQHRAVTAEAALAEQRATTVECLDASGAALTRALDRADNAEDAARTAIDNHGRAEAELATLREGIRQCGGDPTSVQNVYAQLRSRTRQWRDAEQRATRYRTAWFAARRDRRADRAAMAAELPDVIAGQQARAAEAAKWWTCHICGARTDTDPCHICETDRPEQPEPCTDPAHVGYATTGEHVHGPAAN